MTDQDPLSYSLKPDPAYQKQKLQSFAAKYHNVPGNPISDRISRVTKQQTSDLVLRQLVQSEKSVTISQKLCSEDQNLLSESFPEYRLTYANTVSEPHGFSHAHRYLETLTALRTFNLKGDEKVFSEDAVGTRRYRIPIIKDIGGNYADHAFRHRLSVHSCCPVLGPVDSVRHQFRLANMASVVDRTATNKRLQQSLNAFLSNTMTYEHQDYENWYFCNRKAEDCPIKARYGIAIHSLYDISVDAICRIMQTAGMEFMLATIFFDPMMLYKSDGEICSKQGSARFGHKVFWKVYKPDEKKSKKLIEFVFENDSSNGYTHDFDEYKQLFLRQLYVSNDGRVAVYKEIIHSRNNVCFIKFTKLPEGWQNMKISQSCFSFSFPEMNDKIVLEGWELTDKGNLKCFRRRFVVVSQIFFDKMCDYAVRVMNEDFNSTRLMGMGCSYNSRLVIGGTSVTTNHVLSNEELMLAVQIIYLITYESKFRNGQVLKDSVAQLQEIRSHRKRNLLSALWFKAFDKMKFAQYSVDDHFSELPLAFSSEKASEEIRTFENAWLNKLNSWYQSIYTYKNRLPSSVTKPFSHMTIREHVKIRHYFSNYVNTDPDYFEVNPHQEILDDLDELKFDNDEPPPLIENVSASLHPYTITDVANCEASGVVSMAVPGDGDCCYTSLVNSYQHTTSQHLSVNALKEILLGKLPQFACSDNTRVELKQKFEYRRVDGTRMPGCMEGNLDVICLFCATYKVNCCLHMVVRQETSCVSSFLFIDAEATDTIHLIYETYEIYDSEKKKNVIVDAGHYSWGKPINLPGGGINVKFDVPKRVTAKSLLNTSVKNEYKVKGEYNLNVAFGDHTFKLKKQKFSSSDYKVTVPEPDSSSSDSDSEAKIIQKKKKKFNLKKNIINKIKKTSANLISHGAGKEDTVLLTSNTSLDTISMNSDTLEDLEKTNKISKEEKKINQNSPRSVTCGIQTHCDVNTVSTQCETQYASVRTQTEKKTQFSNVLQKIYTDDVVETVCETMSISTQTQNSVCSVGTSMELTYQEVGTNTSEEITDFVGESLTTDILKLSHKYNDCVEHPIAQILLTVINLVIEQVDCDTFISVLRQKAPTIKSDEDAMWYWTTFAETESNLSPACSEPILNHESEVEAISIEEGWEILQQPEQEEASQQINSSDQEDVQDLQQQQSIVRQSVVIQQDKSEPVIEQLISLSPVPAEEIQPIQIDPPMTEILKKLLVNSVNIIKSLANSIGTPFTINELSEMYFSLTDEPVPYKQLGYRTFREMLLDQHFTIKNCIVYCPESPAHTDQNTTLKVDDVPKVENSEAQVEKPITQSVEVETLTNYPSQVGNVLTPLLKPQQSENVSRKLYNEATGDIMNTDCDLLMHCISSDGACKAGLARSLDLRFDYKKNLPRKMLIGESYAVNVGNITIINLVTKPKYYEKPTLKTLEMSLKHAFEYASNAGTEVAMPKLGCGRDKLKWCDVCPLVKKYSLEYNVQVTVYTDEYFEPPLDFEKFKAQWYSNSMSVTDNDTVTRTNSMDFGGDTVIIRLLDIKSCFKDFDFESKLARHAFNCDYNYYKNRTIFFSKTTTNDYILIITSERQLDDFMNLCKIERRQDGQKINVNLLSNIEVRMTFKDSIHPSYNKILTKLSKLDVKLAVFDIKGSDEFKRSMTSAFNYISDIKEDNSTGLQKHINDSTTEILSVYATEIDMYTKRAEQFYESVVKSGHFSRAKVVSPNKHEICLYEYDSSSFNNLLYPRGRKDYTHGWDGTKFVRVSCSFVNNRMQITVLDTPSSRYILFWDNMEKFISKLKFDKLQPLPRIVRDNLSVSLVEGVPGCGKTTWITRNHKIGTDLVLVSTRDGCVDIRNRVRSMIPSTEDVDNILETNYRTIDSYLCSGSKVYDTVFIDEALMTHAGEAMYVALISKCKTLKLLGDRNQIPYINRVLGIDVKYHHYDFVPTSDILATTYRCPVDVAGILAPYYKSLKLKSASSVKKSINVVEISNLTNVPVRRDVYYLVFTQNEKKEMKQYLQSKLGSNYKFENNGPSTVHEYQGKQAPIIFVVRTNRQKSSAVFLSTAHCIVALSRHTKSMTYYTVPGMDDKLHSLCSTIITDEILNKCVGGFLPYTPEVSDMTEVDCRVKIKPGEYHDTYKVDGIVDNILRNTLHNVVHPVARLEVTDCVSAVPYYQISEEVSACVTDLQTIYDEIFPGTAGQDMTNDSYMVENSDLNLELSRCVVDTDKLIKLKPVKASTGSEFVEDVKKEKFLKPVLHTLVPFNRNKTTKETLLALIKRNLNVPELAADCDEDRVAEVVAVNFLDMFVDPSNYSLVSEYHRCPIDLSEKQINDWATKTGRRVRMRDDIALHETDLSSYAYMIKTQVKPKLEKDSQFDYQALQTIAYHNPDINTILSPLFQQVVTRITTVMRNKYRIFVNMSPTQLADHFNKYAPPSLVNPNFKALELDVSKFDKSQQRLALKIECVILRMFGLPEHLTQLWYTAHENTLINARDEGVRCQVNYQRKSGDAFTYGGNTVFIMSVISSILDCAESNYYSTYANEIYPFLKTPIIPRSISGNTCVMGVFGGDDSYMVLNFDISSNLESLCELMFNLEVKKFDYNYGYFCSKFFVPIDADHWALIPDPVKLLTKLGRHDMRDHDHIEEYRISLYDQTCQYSDPVVAETLCRAVVERYRVKNFLPVTLLGSLRYFCSHPKLFHSLWSGAGTFGFTIVDNKSLVIFEDKAIYEKNSSRFKNSLPVYINDLNDYHLQVSYNYVYYVGNEEIADFMNVRVNGKEKLKIINPVLAKNRNFDTVYDMILLNYINRLRNSSDINLQEF